jgi:3-vinyl bacteriochlorophyllide hydratase
LPTDGAMIDASAKSVNAQIRQFQLTLFDPSPSLEAMDPKHRLSRPQQRCSDMARAPLYSPAERQRRDASVWTLVQGVLAPLQFLVFLASLALVLRCLFSGEGYALANASVVLKTLVLYTIMVTGSIWEKAVFGKWLFAPAFFWEDVFSMLVLALHTAYLVALFTGMLDARGLMLLALAAYATYVINAAQFIIKLRMARLDAQRPQSLAQGAYAP